MRSNTYFSAANTTEMEFDGYFCATLRTLSGATCETRIYVCNLPSTEPPILGEPELSKLELITYNPLGKQIKQVKEQPNLKENIREKGHSIKWCILFDKLVR